MDTLKITSSVFQHNGNIPKKYTCQGDDFNPPLSIAGAPSATKSMALIMDDPDAPGGTWVHWVVWNIPPTTSIEENTIPGTQGFNDFKRINYGGPCPPTGTHRYFFKVYSLDTRLELPGRITKSQLEEAIENHILAFGELIGLYKKN